MSPAEPGRVKSPDNPPDRSCEEGDMGPVKIIRSGMLAGTEISPGIPRTKESQSSRLPLMERMRKSDSVSPSMRRTCPGDRALNAASDSELIKSASAAPAH